ncbi:MAG: hypothetical protein JG767_1073 [Deferribacteraceae bacterium]|jgi:uncharacterized integral membrane protein|nr:hypothetical protein [Deferribacteraceae bacterium]
MKLISNILKVVIIAAIMILGYLNMQMVEFSYFFTKEPIKVPLILVFIGGLFIGVVFAALIGLVDKFKLKREINSLKKKLADSENEIKRLRTLPLSSEGKQN